MTRVIATLPRVPAGFGLATALMGSLLAALAGPGVASAAPKTVAHVVAVTNHRASPVTALVFTADDEERAQPNLLKSPLKPGETRKLSVRARAGVCSFAVSGAFEDGTDISGSGLDLCKDHVLALVD